MHFQQSLEKILRRPKKNDGLFPMEFLLKALLRFDISGLLIEFIAFSMCTLDILDFLLTSKNAFNTCVSDLGFKVSN